MKYLLVAFLVASMLFVCNSQETEDKDKADQEESGWWEGFKKQMKNILSKWRDDLKGMWNQVMSKAGELRNWTGEMFETFKVKVKDWLEARPDVPDDEKNEIETFINKLRLPTDKPGEP